MKNYNELKAELRSLERRIGAAKREKRRRSLPLHMKLWLPVFRKLLLKTDKSLFAALFNLKSVLVRSPARLRWDGEFFVVTDQTLPEVRYQIRHQRQCNMAYEWGIKARANILAETYFLDQMTFRPGDIFIDCGANVGDVKLWFDVNEIPIKYVGFEPSPIEYACLKQNVSPCEAHNVGLWNTEGELKFFVSSQGADSSLIEPKDFAHVIVTPVARLEKFVSSRIKCLKLEAEGAEPEILQGLGDKLGMIEYITADLGYERGVTAESTLVPVTNFLLTNDFELIDMAHGRICALFRNKRWDAGA